MYNMAELAVNKDGSEVIAEYLVRGYWNRNNSLILKGDYFSQDETLFTNWVFPVESVEGGWEDYAVEIPKGTIFKLIGKNLTFEDEPVRL